MSVNRKRPAGDQPTNDLWQSRHSGPNTTNAFEAGIPTYRANSNASIGGIGSSNVPLRSLAVEPAIADHIAGLFSRTPKYPQRDAEIEGRRRLDRLVNDCNALLVRENREDQIYSEIGRIIGAHNTFDASVIGLIENNDPPTVRIAAFHPMDERCGGPDSAVEKLAGTHMNTIVEAALTGRPATVDMRTDERGPSSGTATHAVDFYKSCAAIPIVGNAEPLGAVAVLSRGHTDWDEHTCAALRTISSNLAISIERVRNVNAMRYAQSEINTLSSERQSILANSIVGIVLLNDRKFVWVNERFSKMFQGSEADFIGKPTAIVYRSREEYERFGERAYRELAMGKVYSADLHLQRLDGTLIWCRLSGHATKEIRDGDSIWILEDISNRKMAEKTARASERRCRNSLIGTIRCLARAIATRDSYTAGHQERVAELAVAIAEKMDLPRERILGIEMGALIHDIGKIHIPGEILTRPGRLSNAEMEFIKTHPTVGHDIFADVDMDWPVADIILQHHEHLDGSGYPNGLAGDQIILEARIVAVADTVEAMSSHRPYRPALPVETGLKVLRDHRGDWFDPAIVDICLDLIESGALNFGVGTEKTASA